MTVWLLEVLLREAGLCKQPVSGKCLSSLETLLVLKEYPLDSVLGQGGNSLGSFGLQYAKISIPDTHRLEERW